MSRWRWWLDGRPRATPEQMAWRLLFTGGPPSPREAPPDPAASIAASLARPAVARYVMDFDADGYLIRGSMDRRPGPWPELPVGAAEVLTPPDTAHGGTP